MYDPTGQTLLSNDASADCAGGLISYEDTPSGCGAGKITHGLRYNELFQRGYYSALNIFEISTGDNVLTRASAAGATKFYIDTTFGVDANLGEDVQQLYFFDGATLTMRAPVTGAGSDANGPYVLAGAPDGRNGNPSTMPPYAPGTIVGRRRYTGRLMGSAIVDERMRGGDITLVGLSAAWAQANGTFTITTAANVDCSVALYESLNQFIARWPFWRGWSQANFPHVGSIYAGSLTTVGCDRLISDVLSSIPSADQWFVRVGHDLIPRLTKRYTAATNSYAYGVTLLRGALNFDPTNLEIDDQNASQLYNSIRVTGDTDPITKQPVIAQVTDPSSIALYGLQIDGSPASNTAIKTRAAAAGYGQGLIMQNSLARAQQKFDMVTSNDLTDPNAPGGMQSGDVVRAGVSVVVQGIDDVWLTPNFAPDSEIAVPENWTVSGPLVRIASSTIGRYEWRAPQGSPSAYAYGTSIPAAPGTTFTFSGFINCPTLSPGSPIPRWNVQVVGTEQVLATVLAQSGTANAIASVPFTIPVGVSRIHVVAQTVGAIWASGYLYFGAPMLALGNVAQPYTANYAAPNQYGLVQSAVTTIDLTKYESSQQVSFSAIEPDWRAAIAEKANALANALRQNTQTPGSFNGYCVSPEAADYAYGSGLTVTTTAFVALFAHGTNPVTIAASSFTLPPQATSWVWLTAGGGWSIQNGPVAVAGAILLAVFQTSATAVLGDYFRAALGQLNTGVAYADPSSLFPVPTINPALSVASGASLNGIAADIDVALTVENVPTDNSANMLQFYWRTHVASGTPNAWIAEDGINLTWSGGNVEPAQGVFFSYGSMVNGATYDLGVAYRGPSGYGAIAVFATGFVANTIAIGAPYMLGGKPVTPTFSLVGVVNGPSANNITADVQVGAIANNQPTDTSLWRVNFWTRLSSQNNDGTAGSNTPGNGNCNWAPQDGLQATGAGSTSPPASANYGTHLSGIPGNQNIDIGMSYENTQRGQSDIGIIAENFATVVIILQAVNAAVRKVSTVSGFSADAGQSSSVTASATLVVPTVPGSLWAFEAVWNAFGYNLLVTLSVNAGNLTATAFSVAQIGGTALAQATSSMIGTLTGGGSVTIGLFAQTGTSNSTPSKLTSGTLTLKATRTS